MINNISIIGTGKIGLPIAECLITKKYKVSFYARRQDVIDHLKLIGGIFIPDISALCRNNKILLVFLNNYEQCIDCLEKILFNVNEGIIIIGSTLSPEEIVSIKNKYETNRIKIVSAPVSGGVKSAKKGLLYSILSCGKSEVEKVRSILLAYSKEVCFVGETIDTALKIKAINQLLVGINNIAMCEAYCLAEKNRIDRKLLFEIIKRCSGNSYIWESRGQAMIDECFDKKASVNTIIKDMNIVNEIAYKSNSNFLLANLVKEIYICTKNAGYGEEDIIAVTKYLKIKDRMEIDA